MPEQSRHDQLIAAGWHYDVAQDRYVAPGSPTDGTARRYNQPAAWQALQAAPAEATTPGTPALKGTRTRRTDPRRQEPQ